MTNPTIGKYCVVRTYSAGVHAGVVESITEGGAQGSSAVLTDSRRLWRWYTTGGVALSGVAQHGIVADESRIDALNPVIYVTGVIEIIPTTDAARKSIDGA